MKREITLEYLRRTDTALSKILNSLSEGAYIVTPDREVIFWNKGAEAITGYSSAEICGLKCRDTRLHHYDMDGNLLCESGECPAVVAFRKGEHINSKIYVVHKSGQRIPVSTHISPITDKNSHIIAIIEIFTDISKEEELRLLIPAISAGRSGRSRPPVPTEAGHPNRMKAAGYRSEATLVFC
jgi:PAS domain S-box-containing protein